MPVAEVHLAWHRKARASSLSHRPCCTGSSLSLIRALVLPCYCRGVVSGGRCHGARRADAILPTGHDATLLMHTRLQQQHLGLGNMGLMPPGAYHTYVGSGFEYLLSSAEPRQSLTPPFRDAYAMAGAIHLGTWHCGQP